MRQKYPRGRWSKSKLSRLETGMSKPSSTDIGRLLDYYGVSRDSGERRELMALCREAQQLGWYHEYTDVLPERFNEFIDQEEQAAAIDTWEEARLPGLLQTSDYARAQLRGGLIVDEEEIERRVEARIARQEIFERTPAPRMRFVVGEAAIRQQVGGPGVMHEQLKHLLKVADRLGVSLGVVPFTAGPHAAIVSFTLFDFDAEEDPPTAYVELLTGSVYVEKPEGVAMYRAAFDSVNAAALSPAESVKLIKAAIANIEE